jgi:hypothetical protein
VGYVELRLSCTCPGAEEVRRNQDQARIDPSEIAQRLEVFRQRSMGDEAARKERVKGDLVKAYEAAATQAVGRPIDPDIALESPRDAMNIIIDMLANMDSDAEAARLLGLMDAQVAAARNAAKRIVRPGFDDHHRDSGGRKTRRWFARRF